MKKWLIALIALAVCFVVGERLYHESKILSKPQKENLMLTFEEMKSAAEKGNRDAQYELARCYDKGNGVTENDTLAFQWYMKAAMRGSGKAKYQVGKSFKNGEGVAKDPMLAAAWFDRAAQDGNAEGQYALGKCYWKGFGVEASQDVALVWLRRAIKNPDGGTYVVATIKQEAANGDEDAQEILQELQIKE